MRCLPVFGSDCKSRSFARKVTRKGARENGESITRNPEVVRPTIEAVTKPGLLDWIVDALHQSHAAEKRFRLDPIARLQDEQSKLQNRLDKLYDDR